MKVLMFGWEFPPFVSGGLGTHCYGLTKSLSDRGIDVTFVMPTLSSEISSDFVRVIQAGREKIVQIASNIKPYIPSIDIHLKGSKGKHHVYGLGFFQEVQRYTELAAKAVSNEECDAIHCHDWMTFPVGMVAKKEKNRPLVVTIHSTEFDRSPLSPNPWITQIEWEGMYVADKIITVSNYEKEKIIENYNVPSDKIEVIYNAVDTETFKGEKKNFGTDDRVVLFLGRMTLQKGPDYLLYAAKKILEHEKDVKFVLVGTGDMLPELINKSINLGIGNSVFFTGYQESNLEFYKMADVFIMPSVSEPFGITALEAMASGAPVIVSRQSGVSEVISHCMTVDFWDTDSLANKIIGILRHPPLERELKNNGHAEVQKFSWLNVADATINIYSELVK